MSDAIRTALMLCRGTLWRLLVEHGRGEASFSEDTRRLVDMSERAAADALEGGDGLEDDETADPAK